MLSRCFLDFSVGVWAFVIGLSQISSFLSYYGYRFLYPLVSLSICQSFVVTQYLKKDVQPRDFILKIKKDKEMKTSLDFWVNREKVILSDN